MADAGIHLPLQGISALKKLDVGIAFGLAIAIGEPPPPHAQYIYLSTSIYLSVSCRHVFYYYIYIYIYIHMADAGIHLPLQGVFFGIRDAPSSVIAWKCSQISAEPSGRASSQGLKITFLCC